MAVRNCWPLPVSSRRAGERGADLVGVTDSVQSHETVGAEQFDGVEVRQGGIEQRQRVLVAVRGIDVQQPRLQGERALAVAARGALEQQAGRATLARRQRTMRITVLAERGIVQGEYWVNS